MSSVCISYIKKTGGIIVTHSPSTPGDIDNDRRDFKDVPHGAINHRLDGCAQTWPKQDHDVAETQQQDNGAWIDLAVQAAEIGIWSWDITHDRIELTKLGRVLHGLPSDVLVRYRTWLMTLHADDQEPTRQAMQRALDARTDYQNEYRVNHPDGGERWIAAQGRGFFDGAGNPLRLMGVLLDITARKQAEQALKDQHRGLAHMARVSTLGELSAALAHELNQPLTAILCNAQAGQRFLAQSPPDREEWRAILADIVADAQRAGAIVSRLRALFKKEAAVQQVLNINTLIEDVAQLLHSDLITKQVYLLLHLRPDLPKTRGDPVQVRQVLLNLVMNGAEAMAASAVGPRPLRICTSLHDADNLEISVRDSGPGIAPRMLAQIFEPFVTGKPQGLGMGLAISRTIVSAHDGRLWADNAPEGGATLRFTLPIFRELNP